MSLHRLLGMHAAIPDADGLTSFYGELGLLGDADKGFTGTDGGAAVSFEEGPFRRLDSVSIGCSDPSDLHVIAERLTKGGADVTTGDGYVSVTEPASRVRFDVKIAEPFKPRPKPTLIEPNSPGNTVRRNRRAPGVLTGPRPPRRLGHLVIGSPDVKATVSMLSDGLGMKISDQMEGIIAFLRCSTDHHNIAVVESAVPILQHYSWECDDIDHVGLTATSLYRRDPERHTWGIGRHFAGSNFYWYLKDPAGSFIELYSDLDQIDDDDDWEAEGRTPFELEHIANAWGPNLPLEFVLPADLDELQKAWEAPAWRA